MRQIIGVTEQHQVVETHPVPAHGRKSRQPIRQCRLVCAPTVPRTGGGQKSGKRIEGQEVGLVLAVRVDQNPAQLVAQLGRPTGVRPEKNPGHVVVVRMQIVPENRLTLQRFLQLHDAFNRDFPGDDLRPGPENVDTVGKRLADLLQVTLPAKPFIDHPLAVRRRAENQPPVLLGQVLAVKAVRRLALCLGQAAERSPVGLSHLIRNIVKQDRKGTATGFDQLPKPLIQLPHFIRVGIANRQAGGDPVKKINSPIPARIDQFAKPQQFVSGVRLPPQRTVLEIILRAVQVGVQTKLLHPLQQLQSLRLTPRPPVKPLNNALEK